MTIKLCIHALSPAIRIASSETNDPYEEDEWLGMLITCGNNPDSAKLAAIKPDPRCATINFHPETSIVNPKILRSVVQNHNNTLGIYCTIIREGKIRAGNPIYLSQL